MSEEVSVNQATPETPRFVYEPDESAGRFVMLIAQEEVPTVDGRMFSAGAIDWRELPIPLTLNRANTAEGQHKTAVGIGAITEIWRQGNSIYGKGYFASDESGQEARALIKEGTISGVSADVGGVVVQEMSNEDGSDVRRMFTKGTIIGVTALLHASFNDTKIAVEDDALTAAAARGWTPPSDAFKNPNLSRPTPLTITEDGRVFGHAATWGTCHVGYKDRCVTPPRSRQNYQFFNIGEVLTNDGKKVPVGRITANTNHAPIEFGAQPAQAHYDHTGFAAAYVMAGEDEHGIWFSGVVAPDATDAQVANLRAAGVSGDWRNINGNLEMVGLLAVNTPGFPVPRAQTNIVAGAQMSLVAAGILDTVAEVVEVVDMVEAKPALIEQLKTLLADTQTVYHLAQGYHWNVKGKDFAQYHELFGEIYSDIYSSIDPLAENLLKMGENSPFSLPDFIRYRSISESNPGSDPVAMATALLVAINELVSSLKVAFKAADRADEQGVADFIAGRIDSTQKWAWQLRSSIGVQASAIEEECGCDDEEFAAKKKGDCGCGCDGDCADAENKQEFGFGKKVDWSSDLDQNYLMQVQNHFEEIRALSEQAMDFGTRLTMPVQTYASYVIGIVSEEINFLDRTLGRTTAEEVEEEAETNEVPAAAYSTEDSEELSLESRLLLLDLDLDLDV